MPARQIAERLAVPPGTFSFHLKELSHAGQVRARQEGRFVIYSADFECMAALMSCLTHSCCKGMPSKCLETVETALSHCCSPNIPPQEAALMKRLHVRVSIQDLDANVRFYSTVFGQLAEKRAQVRLRQAGGGQPAFTSAISKRGAKAGLDHLGLQVDLDEGLVGLRRQVEQVEIAVLGQAGAACSYARSDKRWMIDPQGIARESFRTIDTLPVFCEDTRNDAKPTTARCSRAALA